MLAGARIGRWRPANCCRALTSRLDIGDLCHCIHVRRAEVVVKREVVWTFKFVPKNQEGPLSHKVHGEGTEGTETPRKYFRRVPSHRMQVGEEIAELLLGERAADGRHHVAAGEDGLADESFIGRQSAGEKWFFEELLQAGTILSGNRMRVVAGRTILLI